MDASDGREAAPAPGRPAGTPVEAPGPSGPLAAFDFDGTLTVRDSFVAFLRWRTRRAAWIAGLLRLAPNLLAYLVHRDRGRLKSASVRVFLRGTPRAALTAEAEAFAAATFDGLMRPDALAAWVDQGRRTRVIVTASPEEIVAPFARRLAADVLIGSRLRWTADGHVGDGLDGPNCRGPEKVRRLEARFGQDLDLREAYGDTAGDREMLARAAVGHMQMFTGRPAQPARRERPSAAPPSRRSRSPGG